MSTYLRHLRMISRSAWFFTAARFVFAISGAITEVFLNFYLKSLSLSPLEIGVANAVRIFGAIGVFFVTGLIDRLGRRRVMLIGAAMSVLGWVLTFSSQALPLILLSQVLRGVGDVMFGIVVVPMMAELAKGEERTTMFSTSEGITLLGLFLGGWLAGPISDWLWGTFDLQAKSAAAYQGILFFASIIRVLGLLPLLLVRPEDADDDMVKSGGPTAGQKAMQQFDPEVLFRVAPHVFWLLIPWALAFLGGGLVARTWNLYADFTFKASEGDIGRLLGLISLVDGIVTLASALFATWFGIKRVSMVALLGSAVTLVALMFAGNFMLAAVIILLRAAVINMLEPIYRAYVIDSVKREDYTVVAVLISAATNIGQLAGPIVAGVLQPSAGDYRFLLPLSALVFVGAAYALWRIMGNERTLPPLFDPVKLGLVKPDARADTVIAPPAEPRE